MSASTISIAKRQMISKAESARSLRAMLASALFSLVALGAAALWAVSLQEIDTRNINDYGLASVLPGQMIASLAALITIYCLALRQQRLSVPLLTLIAVVLIVILYGTPTLVEEVPRFQSTWKHVGITDYIMRTGGVDPSIDAYFNWPGFFILSAFVTEVTGLASPISFVAWAPILFNLLYLGPLLMILKSATDDLRLVWLGVWLFYLSNWIGQDYFSPQGLNLFLHMTVVAVLLKWFKVERPAPSQFDQYQAASGLLAGLRERFRDWLAPPERSNTPSRSAQRAGLLAIIVAVFAVSVSEHQLTPFMALASVTALVVFNRCTVRSLPILMLVLIGTWISYMTVAYLAGHLYSLTGSVGEVSAVLDANVTGRLAGSEGHKFVVNARILMTVAIWGLALLGGIRSIRNGYWDLTYALLAVAPFPLLVLQPYGGEMLLRIYLFVLPIMVFFAAALFYTTSLTGRSWWTTIGILLTSLALLSGFVFARYGNERMDAFSADEANAVEYLYSIAKPNSLFVAATWNVPWRHRDYEKHDYVPVTEEVLLDDVDALAKLMKSKKHSGAYLLITRNQLAFAELFSKLPPGSLVRFEQELINSGKFELIYSNPDADIFVLAEAKDRLIP